MAKFALVGYGSDGRGVGTTEQGYTYVVNDNVRTGDRLQPIATSRKGRKFVTTGVVNHSYKQTSIKGQEVKQRFDENETKKGKEITTAYTGKELGISGSRVPKQKGELSEYTQATRGANIAQYKQKDPNAEWTEKSQETFESYSKKFMNEGEQ